MRSSSSRKEPIFSRNSIDISVSSGDVAVMATGTFLFPLLLVLSLFSSLLFVDDVWISSAEDDDDDDDDEEQVLKAFSAVLVIGGEKS